MRRLASAALALSLLGIFWSGYARVKPTNFSGHDEWLVLWLGAEGGPGFPSPRRVSVTVAGREGSPRLPLRESAPRPLLEQPAGRAPRSEPRAHGLLDGQ